MYPAVHINCARGCVRPAVVPVKGATKCTIARPKRLENGTNTKATIAIQQAMLMAHGPRGLKWFALGYR